MFVKRVLFVFLLAIGWLSADSTHVKEEVYVRPPQEVLEKIHHAFTQKLQKQKDLSPSRVAGWAVFTYCYLGKEVEFGRKLDQQESLFVLQCALPYLQKEGHSINSEIAEGQLRSLYEYMQNRFPHEES